MEAASHNLHPPIEAQHGQVTQTGDGSTDKVQVQDVDAKPQTKSLHRPIPKLTHPLPMRLTLALSQKSTEFVAHALHRMGSGSDAVLVVIVIVFLVILIVIGVMATRSVGASETSADSKHVSSKAKLMSPTQQQQQVRSPGTLHPLSPTHANTIPHTAQLGARAHAHNSGQFNPPLPPGQSLMGQAHAGTLATRLAADASVGAARPGLHSHPAATAHAAASRFAGSFPSQPGSASTLSEGTRLAVHMGGESGTFPNEKRLAVCLQKLSEAGQNSKLDIVSPAGIPLAHMTISGGKRLDVSLINEGSQPKYSVTEPATQGGAFTIYQNGRTYGDISQRSSDLFHVNLLDPNNSGQLKTQIVVKGYSSDLNYNVTHPSGSPLGLAAITHYKEGDHFEVRALPDYDALLLVTILLSLATFTGQPSSPTFPSR